MEFFDAWNVPIMIKLTTCTFNLWVWVFLYLFLRYYVRMPAGLDFWLKMPAGTGTGTLRMYLCHGLMDSAEFQMGHWEQENNIYILIVLVGQEVQIVL